MFGSETALQERRSVFFRRPIATARAIALRVVDLLVFEVAGEHWESSDTSAATFRDCLEDRLQDSLFGSTEHAEVDGGGQVHRLLSHGRPSTIAHVQQQVPGEVGLRSALRTGASYECVPGSIRAGVGALALVKGVTMRRTIAHMD